MKAYWLETHVRVSAQELKVHGIDYMRLDVSAYQPELDRIKHAQGFSKQDISDLNPSIPEHEKILEKIKKEHSCTEDLACLVLSGNGIFDVRSNDDEWIRVEVAAADYISISARRHHRFIASDSQSIRFVCLLKDAANIAPQHRELTEAAYA